MERYYHYIQEQTISLNNLLFQNYNIIKSVFRYDLLFFIFRLFFFFRGIHKISKSDCWASSCLSVCLSVRPSVRLSMCLSLCPHAWNNSAPTRRIFMKFAIWGFFDICLENWSLMKIWREQRVIHMKIHVHFLYYFAALFLEREVFQTKAVHKIKKFYAAYIFFTTVVPLMR